MSRKAHYLIFNIASVILVVAILAGLTYAVCRSWVKEFDSWTMEERINY